MPMEKHQQFNLGYIMIAVMLFILFQQWWQTSRQVEIISFSRFETLLAQGQIDKVWVKDNVLEGLLKEPSADGKSKFITTRVESDIAALLSKHGVEFSRVIESRFWTTLLSWVAPAIFFVFIWLFLSQRFMNAQGGMMSLGKSKAKVYVEANTKTTFADVAGIDEAKVELQEIVDFLKNPTEYSRLGARPPKGILLVGPPGTGKTLLARAVAGEAGVTFFSINGSEFVEMFVGLGAARVRDLFDQAAKAAPCIIFIDELDALGKARGLGGFGGHDEKEQTLNQLLVELDGFNPAGGIVLLAATNRPEILDSALLRAGRFDRQVLVDRPDKIGRVAILNVHSQPIRMDNDVDLEQVAALTPGFTGADLANLVNEAALLATRRGADAVFATDFTEAIERIVAGLEKKSRILNPHERKVVAFHEMGHALVAMALPGMDPVHKISIIPRGIGALGYTIQRPTQDRFLMSKTELQHKIAVLLGGRASEALIFHEISTGAGDDLQKATEIARDMVMRFGMSDTLGHVVFEGQKQAFLGYPNMEHNAQYSEQTAQTIDNEVQQLVDSAYQQASALLQQHRPLLEQYAALLLKTETLSQSQLSELKALMQTNNAKKALPVSDAV